MEDKLTKTEIKHSIVIVRGMPVIMASELASFFETTVSVVNQYRKRNAEKFTEDYAFQLSSDEWKSLKSQNVISNKGRGGSRHLPWAYTEHGVAMMSMGMKSENAVRLSKVIIDTFVDYRRGTLPSNPVVSGANAAKHRRSLQEKIYHQMEQILDVKLPTSDGHTVRDELSVIATKSLGHIKAVLDTPAKNNERISAEITRILAEAEKLYAETRKLHVETDTLVLQNYRARLGFIRDLREMAQQLERDDWVVLFDDGFGNTERKLLVPKT
jgi:hypothetical protein